MRPTAFLYVLMLALCSIICVACGDYANSLRKDVGSQGQGPNPGGNFQLPDPNFVPKPDPATDYVSSASPVVMDEVLLHPAGIQWVELLNWTGFEVDLGGWTLAGNDAAYTFPYGFALAPGSRIVIHLGLSGADSDLERYAPHFTIDPEEGSLTLLRAGSEVVHFVQWGSPDHRYEVEAVEAGLWSPGDFTEPAPEGYSLQYDGEGHNGVAWYIAQPTPGQ